MAQLEVGFSDKKYTIRPRIRTYTRGSSESLVLAILQQLFTSNNNKLSLNVIRMNRWNLTILYIKRLLP